MRLLNTSTLEVEEFLQSQVPEYVILSHFWQEEEVTLSDIQSGTAFSKKGYSKLKSCAKKAVEDGFAYCWIDTCCIDKTSSAELSEAINSMYRWYRDANICYAYLADFEIDADDIGGTYQSFAKSRWFTRGWTLQELIAPIVVEFYSKDWVDFGTRLSLQDKLVEITGITIDVLDGENPLSCGVGVRMSWAANRRTSRVEDEAYCLMGLFSINMPLLYGEGTRAFRRLQEEILRVEEDYTLFAWSPRPSAFFFQGKSHGLFAKSPADFSKFTLKAGPGLESLDEILPTWRRENIHRNCFRMFSPPIDYVPPNLTSRGLRIMLPLLEYAPEEYYLCLTLVEHSTLGLYLICITLKYSTTRNQDKRYIRNGKSVLLVLPGAMKEQFKYTSIYVDSPSVALGRLPSTQPGWPWTDNPSFLLVKIEPALLQHLSSMFSALVSLQSLLKPSSPSIASNFVLPVWDQATIASGQKSYKNFSRFEASVSMLKSMSCDELVTLGMGDLATCYILGSQFAHNAIGFVLENADEGFWVHMTLSESPSCKIYLGHSMQLEKEMIAWMDDPNWSGSNTTDRATILLNRTATNVAQDSALPPLKINVSVRRIAPARGVSDHVRYMLSLSSPNERLISPIHPAESTLSHTNS